MPQAGCRVIVVGGGACGILAAAMLTDAGLDVLLLESGPDIRKGRADAARLQPIQSRCWRCDGDFAELFVDDALQPYTTAGGDGFLWIRGRQVGGRMVAWSGIAAPLTDADFAPALPGHQRWPLRYADLAPYYRVAEHAVDVRGGCVVDQATGRYLSSYSGPWPAAALHFKTCVEAVWPERQVLFRPASPTPADSWTGSIGTLPIYRLLEKAERSGRLTLRDNATVTRVIVDERTGLASGVAARDSRHGEPFEFRSSAVLACASTIETARLLLNSSNPRHPAGLGNGFGLVGRHLMEHASGIEITGCRSAFDDGRRPAEYVHPLLIPRYRNLAAPFGRFVGGYWWQGYAIRSRQIGPYDVVHLTAFAEVQPRADNRVRLREDLSDAHGVPLAEISFALSQNEYDMVDDMVETGRAMLNAAGFDVVRFVDRYQPNGLSIHEVGTARMGTDPSQSVLNDRNQLWDCENVYVTDGSAFPSAGSVNPTLTMLALTARACDSIAARIRGRGERAARRVRVNPAPAGAAAADGAAPP